MLIFTTCLVFQFVPMLLMLMAEPAGRLTSQQPLQGWNVERQEGTGNAQRPNLDNTWFWKAISKKA
jgi:hypothetical protein